MSIMGGAPPQPLVLLGQGPAWLYRLRGGILKRTKHRRQYAFNGMVQRGIETSQLHKTAFN